MEVITKVLDELIDIPPNHFVFDIETTGLNSNYCKVILIGILFNQDNKTVIKQYFANTEDDEKELLLSFINDIKNYKNHITFNGLTFDIPFLNTRLKKHNIDFSLSKNDDIDILKLIRPFKEKLSLSDCKLKTIEKYLGIYREDTISGKESIDLYKEYSVSQDIDLKEKILLHNYEDTERRQSLRSFIFVNTLYEVINMLTIRKENFRDDEINVILDGLVPENHLVRKIENAIDFSFIYDKVKDLYSPLGAPSIDPVVLIKIVLIQYLFGIPSMRQTIREIEVNVAYRWFLGYSLTEKIPHFSTFNKNYERRFKNTDLFESIFKEILARATKCGFVDSSNIYIDSTHIKASANKKKYTKVEVDIQAKHYQEKLEKEINEDRLKHGKSPLCEVKNEEVKKKEKIESNTDKDSGMFFKNEKEKCFAYLAHTACDNNNFILDFHITSGNIHDSVAFSDLYQKIKNNSKQHTTAIAIDAGYITPYICKTILDDGIIPAIPYKRPLTKKGFFKKYDYVYDEYYDCYICPNNKILKYSTTNRDGYREYKSNPSDCKSCEHLNICTNSKNKQKLVTRHIWQNYLEEADHLRHKPYVKKVYSKRKETIERVFADAKEKHGMRYTKLRGLSKIEMEVSLIFSCMNLKKLANWMWKDTSSNLRLTPIFSILSLKIFIKKKIAI